MRPLRNRRGVRGTSPTAILLDENRDATVTMSAVRRILDDIQQREFDEYRESLAEFYAYRAALIERMSQR